MSEPPAQALIAAHCFMLVNSDLSSVISYVVNLGEVQQALRKYGDWQLPQADPRTHCSPVESGD